jgi:hypothetical protein
MLAALGWHTADIEREPTLIDPKTGLPCKPDYLLKADGKYVCVIEAKKTTQSVTEPKNILQAYTYACNFEVHCQHYALCNGREFALWRSNTTLAQNIALCALLECCGALKLRLMAILTALPTRLLPFPAEVVSIAG